MELLKVNFGASIAKSKREDKKYLLLYFNKGLKGLFKLYYGYRIKGAAADDIYYNKDHAFNFRVY